MSYAWRWMTESTHTHKKVDISLSDSAWELYDDTPPVRISPDSPAVPLITKQIKNDILSLKMAIAMWNFSLPIQEVFSDF